MTAKSYKIEFQPNIPEGLSGLTELANDLYYGWNSQVRKLFHRLDNSLWQTCKHNPPSPKCGDGGGCTPYGDFNIFTCLRICLRIQAAQEPRVLLNRRSGSATLVTVYVIFTRVVIIIVTAYL